MIINFSLNGKPVKENITPHQRSVEILNEIFQCQSAHHHCKNAECGLCLILVDNLPVLSCFLPAFELRSRDVWTMEGIATLDGYEDLLGGFTEAGVQLCPQCAAARALSAEALLRETLSPSQEQIAETASIIKCHCTPFTHIIEALNTCANRRKKRLNDA